MAEINQMQEGRCRECKEGIVAENLIWKYESGTKMFGGYNCHCGYTEEW